MSKVKKTLSCNLGCMSKEIIFIKKILNAKNTKKKGSVKKMLNLTQVPILTQIFFCLTKNRQLYLGSKFCPKLFLSHKKIPSLDRVPILALVEFPSSFCQVHMEKYHWTKTWYQLKDGENLVPIKSWGFFIRQQKVWLYLGSDLKFVLLYKT